MSIFDDDFFRAVGLQDSPQQLYGELYAACDGGAGTGAQRRHNLQGIVSPDVARVLASVKFNVYDLLAELDPYSHYDPENGRDVVKLGEGVSLLDSLTLPESNWVTVVMSLQRALRNYTANSFNVLATGRSDAEAIVQGASKPSKPLPSTAADAIRHALPYLQAQAMLDLQAAGALSNQIPAIPPPPPGLPGVPAINTREPGWLDKATEAAATAIQYAIKYALVQPDTPATATAEPDTIGSGNGIIPLEKTSLTLPIDDQRIAGSIPHLIAELKDLLERGYECRMFFLFDPTKGRYELHFVTYFAGNSTEGEGAGVGAPQGVTWIAYALLAGRQFEPGPYYIAGLDKGVTLNPPPGTVDTGLPTSVIDFAPLDFNEGGEPVFPAGQQQRVRGVVALSEQTLMAELNTIKHNVDRQLAVSVLFMFASQLGVKYDGMVKNIKRELGWGEA